MSGRMWMVRAGRGAEYIHEFKESGLVALGWKEIGDLSTLPSRQTMTQKVAEAYPSYSDGKATITGSQLFRFAHEIQKNDEVLSFDSARRVYLYGTVHGAYRYDPESYPERPHIRHVKWIKEINREEISIGTKNVLGAISTLFLIKEPNANELRAIALGEQESTTVDEVEEPDTVEEIFKDVESRSREFIKDKISALDWEDAQDLVAGLLEAMGYKTQVSKSGPDRGKDIIASPDGFGFEQPRIVVEVKHREGTISAPQIRSFLGGRHKDDKGLYVSTGGFTRDAQYEADRASIPLKLMEMDDLVDTLLEYYERLDMETQALVPLTKVYWPK